MITKRKSFLVWEGVENVEAQPEMSYSEYIKKIDDQSIAKIVPDVKWIGIQTVKYHSCGKKESALIDQRFK